MLAPIQQFPRLPVRTMAGVSFLPTLTSLRLRPHSPRPSLAFAGLETSSGVVCCYRKPEDAGEADERCVYHRRDVLRCVGAVVGMVLLVSTMSDDNSFAIHRSILLLFHYLKFLMFGS
ncbi:hypothetical protein BHE74_00044900 [Ensete ventricosum]|nr:hypothetical protein BHE74_00044900 [Ensete ventricosum]